jgi:hypothetical protein
MTTKAYQAFVNNVPSIPPLIPDNPIYESNYSKNIRVTTMTIGSLTDGLSTLAGGRLTGILAPTDPQDAANKAYTDSVIPGKIPHLPNNSVQFNNNSEFDSSSLLTYTSSITSTSTASILYSANTQIGSVVIGSGTMTNLSDPVNEQDAATKNYVDNFNSLTTNTITSGTSAVYTASQMVGSIIYRNGFTGTVSDTTATAGSIITEISGSVGSSVKFNIANTVNTNSTSGLLSTLYLIPGTGVTFNPTTSILVRPGYQLNSYIIVTSGTSVTLAVTSNNPYYVNSNFVLGHRSINSKAKITRITNKFVFNTKSTTYSVQNLTYTADIINGLIYRDYAGPMTDTFGTVASFINGIISPTGPLDYIWSTGSVELVIKNTSSATSTGILTLTGSTGWTMDPNSSFVIGPQETGMFYLGLNTATVTGTIYVIGIT